MPNVYIVPTPQTHRHEGGMLRVVGALARYLPEFGWNPVDSPDKADLINSHATEIVNGYEHLPVVQSSHGLMWMEYFGDEWNAVNAQCIKALKRADAVTAPSQWVAKAIARGIAVQPRVIYHGVDIDEWKPVKKHDNYVLWNKARSDEVSDHKEVERLAALMPDVKFVSTIGNETANLKVCGVQSYDAMKPIISGAGVYLALARETFGIGTLEALASGVPVVGWDYGGQSEIVRQGETGYLAAYGDWAALSDAVRRSLAERKRLARGARADAVERWGWRERIGEYARLFDSLIKPNDRPKVSVIVTCYNLAGFLADALNSIFHQSMNDWECIIVDDSSTDGTPSVSQAFTVYDGVKFRYIRTSRNLGLPAARNFGIEHARGKYIIPLDADDRLTPNALTILSDALDRDKSLHIAYGHLQVMSEDGTQTRDSGWPKQPFDWRGQLSHQTQSPYCAMMRRSIFERTQGYRRRSWQAEDAELLCYLTSFGFNAQRVTDELILLYRLRHDSKTRSDNSMGTQWSNGDWTAWYPFLRYPEATPFGAQGDPPNGKRWTISHRQAPDVSVIIPVGPQHTEIVQDALDSLLTQSFSNWECIVVNDSGKDLDLRGYSFVTRIETEGNRGTGTARNIGARHARADLLLFLDADDFLQPSFLHDTLSAYRAHSNKQALVYTDWFQEYGDGQGKVWQAQDFECARIFRQMIYNISVLHPKAAFEAVGGFDETLFGWEDWDYFIKMAIAGYDAVHVVKPLMTYRYHTGQRRENAYQNKDELLPAIKARYGEYIAQGGNVACGCKAARVTPPPMKQQTQAQGNENGDMVLMEFTGNGPNTHRVVGKATQTAYRFANNDSHRVKYVYKADVPSLMALRFYQPVNSTPLLDDSRASPLIVKERAIQ